MLISALGCDILCAPQPRRLIGLPELSTSKIDSKLASKKKTNPNTKKKVYFPGSILSTARTGTCSTRTTSFK